jgi:hypothetical protein
MNFYVRLALTSGLALRIKGAAYFTKSKLSETDNTAKAAKIDLPVGLTAHCHRSGSATAAKELQVDAAVFCQIADWDVGGKTFLRSTIAVI